ncbi:MAG: hypothetical protein PUK54_07840, partial [Firmicutes bacterium]|nr:hypothetical protein [Bacillota bacterium]MDY5856752.1 hypothetical protein [Anaerovoracaceae bacterium]
IKEYINNNKLPKMYDDALENRVAISAFNLSLNAILDQNSLVQKNERIKCILNEGRRKIALGKIKTTEMPVYWKVFFRFAKSNMSFAILIMIVAANKLKGWIK